MSVIHEALKKIGEPVVRQPRIVPVKAKKTQASQKPVVFLGTLTLLIGSVSFFAGQFLSPGRDAAALVPSAALGQFGVEEIPVAPSPSFFRPAHSTRREPFTLNGIAQTGSDFYCLINGAILRRGQTVDGATVESITPDTVILDLRGKKILLISR